MTNHIRFDIPLRPVMGSVFQPTGFPDMGAAVFHRPERGADGSLQTVDCLLVESAQSMANRFEAVGWDDAANAPVSALDGLSWVRVVAADDGRFLTSSRLEAHRLASAFVKNATLDGTSMIEVLRDRLAMRKDTPLDHHRIAEAVFALDPMCLIHGAFFADKDWPGQPKLQRAITGMIEAVGVEPVDYGGVKRDHVRHENVEGGGSKEGYGSVPFHRREYAAAEISLHISVDLGQLRSYGLGEPATGLLESIALWEVRSLLEGGMARLRTACHLDAVEVPPELPPLSELEARIRDGVAAVGDLAGAGGPIDVVWSPGKK